jgi:hypothetical protein
VGPLGELGALFNPGMRHEIEERQAKANRREEEGNARDGDLRIDLASGVAVINLSKSGDHAAAPAANGDPHRILPPAEADVAVNATQQAEQQVEPAEHSDDAGHAVTEQGSAGSHAARSDGAGDASALGAPDADVDAAAAGSARAAKPLTAAQARRLATAARRSANGDQPARTAAPRPANAQRPSSKASRAAR